MKKLGIIGGMGPEATNHLVLKIINGFLKTGQKSRPDILVSFIPIDLEVENNLICRNETGNFPELLMESAIILEKGGTDFIIIASNTAHLFINVVRKVVKIPVLSVIEELGNLNNVDSVGIIATSITMKRLLGLRLLKNQQAVDKKLADLAKGIVDTDFFVNVVSEFVSVGKTSVCLACSDLQNISWPPDLSSKIKIIDTMDILVNKTINCLLE